MEKKTKKKVILINSSLLIFMIIGVVFAWFASNFDNSLDSNDVTVISDNTLELSVNPDVDGWSTSIHLSDKAWFQNVKFTDITGSGNGTFLRPVLTQGVDYASVSGTWDTDPVGSNVSDSKTKSDYAKFTLNMRSKDPLKVYLGAESSVEPLAGDKLMGEGTVNQSSFSTAAEPFSKDIVVGAVRLSVCNSSTKTRMFTWIPRPDIYCNATDAKVTYDSILLNQTTGPSFTHSYYASTTATSPASMEPEITGEITNDNKKLLYTLNSSRQTDGYFYGSVDVYIWIEGCDNEARRAFVDGKFRVNLNITSEDTTEETTTPTT